MPQRESRRWPAPLTASYTTLSGTSMSTPVRGRRRGARSRGGAHRLTGAARSRPCSTRRTTPAPPGPATSGVHGLVDARAFQSPALGGAAPGSAPVAGPQPGRKGSSRPAPPRTTRSRSPPVGRSLGVTPAHDQRPLDLRAPRQRERAGTATSGIPDIDISLVDPSGTVLSSDFTARSRTSPTANWRKRLWPA